jgi:lysophospholipase L1-like esterase
MVRFLLSLFSVVVFASEGVLSPLADNQQGISPPPVVVSRPSLSFAQLTMKSTVLGASTEIPETTPSAEPTKAPTDTPAPRVTIKKHMTIAVLGDSMVDTLGPGVPALQDRLKRLYPGTTFTILNYGVGATNIEYGIERLTNSYTYLGNPVPSLVSQNPDVVVVESFGYNPFSYDEGAMDHHWLSMAKIVDILKAQLSSVKIIFAATIAPNATVFGDGAPGLSFAAEDKARRVAVIKRYIENTINFARSQKLPIADAYHASLGNDGNGKITYINPGDHIHYSDAGRALMAQKMTEAITKALQ